MPLYKLDNGLLIYIFFQLANTIAIGMNHLFFSWSL